MEILWGKGTEYNRENFGKKLSEQFLSPVWSKYYLERMVMAERYNQLWKKGNQEIFTLTLNLLNNVTEKDCMIEFKEKGESRASTLYFDFRDKKSGLCVDYDSMAKEIRSEDRLIFVTCYFSRKGFSVIDLFSYDDEYKNLRYHQNSEAFSDIKRDLGIIFDNFRR